MEWWDREDHGTNVRGRVGGAPYLVLTAILAWVFDTSFVWMAGVLGVTAATLCIAGDVSNWWRRRDLR